MSNKMFDKCSCSGCNRQRKDNQTPYCKECLKHLVFIDEKGTDSGWYYCRIHQSPPTKEERVDYLITSKAYLQDGS